ECRCTRCLSVVVVPEDAVRTPAPAPPRKQTATKPGAPPPKQPAGASRTPARSRVAPTRDSGGGGTALKGLIAVFALGARVLVVCGGGGALVYFYLKQGPSPAGPPNIAQGPGNEGGDKKDEEKKDDLEPKDKGPGKDDTSKDKDPGPKDEGKRA